MTGDAGVGPGELAELPLPGEHPQRVPHLGPQRAPELGAARPALQPVPHGHRGELATGSAARMSTIGVRVMISPARVGAGRSLAAGRC